MGAGPMAKTLRHRKSWLAGGMAFVVLVIYLSLTPNPISAPSLGSFKAGHIAAYAWLMFWFAQLYPTRRRRFAVAMALWGMGIALEYVQDLVGRDFAYSDMADDGIGVFGGWLVAMTPLSRAFAVVDGWWRA
jgi:hypothetical protein